MKKTIAVIFTMTLLLAMSLTNLSPVYAAGMTEATQASALKRLGLFKGVSATDFDLHRAPTRTEALVMLIRVLGKEAEALNSGQPHPFTDVASWADGYVGYAYENGLTKGISATEFGAGDATCDMYLTFVLRALGHDDSAGDFAWDEPDALAKSAGILPDSVDTASFMRADVARVSWAALEAKLKDGSQTLAEKLMGAALFQPEDYDTAKLIAGGLPTTAKDAEAVVSTFAELETAVQDTKISLIRIGSDIDITSDLVFERDSDLVIYVEKGKTLTVSKEFTPVFCLITNDGVIDVNGTFVRGASRLINNGLVTVKAGGTSTSGMCEAENLGAFTVDAGGTLLIEKGSLFHNCGTLTNDGNISVKDGGQLNAKGGSIVNNGTIDLSSYFNGDITKITGTGTLNDNR